jgi:hypothetical protein
MINPQKLGEEIMKHRLYKKGKPDLQAAVGEFRVLINQVRKIS